MSREAAASYLHVSTQTIDRLRKNGELRTVPIHGMVRIPEFDVKMLAVRGTVR